jgi:hypothetical protein
VSRGSGFESRSRPLSTFRASSSMAELSTFNPQVLGSIPRGPTCGCSGEEPRRTHDPEAPFESDTRHQVRLAQWKSVRPTRGGRRFESCIGHAVQSSTNGGRPGFQPGGRGFNSRRLDQSLVAQRQSSRLLTGGYGFESCLGSLTRWGERRHASKCPAGPARRSPAAQASGRPAGAADPKARKEAAHLVIHVEGTPAVTVAGLESS